MVPGGGRLVSTARKSAVITQSNYIPWKGYFDAINLVDEVVLLDDVQFTRRDWRNRNRIKTPQGLRWLTIPIQVKGRFHQRICETRVADADWGPQHFAKIRQSYRKAPYFATIEQDLEALYLGELPVALSDINRLFLSAVCSSLDIRTPFRDSAEFDLKNDANDRLISICLQSGITDYFSGPAAKTYLDVLAFERSGVRVHWLDFTGYPSYDQLHGPFDHHVTVLDLLAHTGPEARSLMKTFPESVARAPMARVARHVAP
jgi:hypothetical protein